MAGASSLAATRGSRDFAKEEVADTTCVKGDEFESSFSNSGEITSGRSSEYCAEVECRTDVKPLSLA